MNDGWLWVIVVGVVAVGFVIGVIVTRGGWQFVRIPVRLRGLPQGYTKPYVPTLAEWRALQFLAENADSTLTDRLIMTSVSVFEGTSLHGSLYLVVGTRTHSDWNVYLGNGQFACTNEELTAAYEEAGRVLESRAGLYFYEIIHRRTAKLFRIQVPKPPGLRIEFFTYDARVGTWEDGKMVLESSTC